MSLHLDSRQRAMLQEMGVPVWWPAPPRPQTVAAAVRPEAGAVLPTTASAVPHPSPIQPPSHTPPPSRVAHHPTATTSTSTPPAESPSATTLVLHPPRLLYPAPDTNMPTPPDLGHAWLIVAEGRAHTDPLAGDAGTLLHHMLRALQLHRHPKVFFCGVELTTGTQTPPTATPEALLHDTLAQIQPVMVLLMGRLAARAALGRTEPLGQLRAQPHSIAGHPAIVTYDAPYLLRLGKYKAAAWADLCHARHLVRSHSIGKE